MNIKSCERKEKNEADIVVEVNAEEFEAALGKAFIKNRNRISVPGFRKGKAPRKIIENMYGETVFHNDALDVLVPDAAKFAAEGSELRIVGLPQATDLDFKDGNKGVDITITVAIYPEVEIGRYKGLSAVKPPAEVADSEVEAEVESMRLRNASVDKVERPAASGDIAVIDYEGFLDGEPFEGGKGDNYDLELGSNSFIPGFEEKIIGMAAGEQREMDLVFPENYAEELAGKPVVFKVKLNEVKEKILPDLDDEFAKDVSEFDTLNEYRASISEKILENRQADADIAFENALMDMLAESIEADIPEAMIEEQMEIAANNFASQVSSRGMDPSTYLQIMGVTPEMFRENMRASSEKQVKVMLCLEKIADIEGIEVSDEDIEDEYKAGAERYQMDAEKLKESVSRETILSDIKMRRAAQIVTDNATAEDPPAESPPVEEAAKKEKTAAKPKKAAAKKPADKPEAADGEAEAETGAAVKTAKKASGKKKTD